MLIPECDEVIAGLQTLDVYAYFCQTIFKQCYGVTKWKMNVTEAKISHFVTPSFEAFVLLACDNCYLPFTHDVNHEPGSDRPPFKYTCHNQATPRNKGWPDEAIQKYNKLHARVVKDRKDNCEFDNEFLHVSKEERANKNRRQVQPENNDDAMVAVHDWAEVADFEKI